MKTIILLIFVCFVCSSWSSDIKLSEEQNAKLKANLQDCIEQEKVSEEDANKIKNLDIENPSAGTKCVSACFFEKYGVLKNNNIEGDTAAQKLIPIIGEEKAKELISKCKDIKGTERCETGFKLFECVWNYQAF